MEKGLEKSYIVDLFNNYYNHLCSKWNLELDAKLMTISDYYKFLFLKRFDIHDIRDRIILPRDTTGYYDHEYDEIVILLKKDFFEEKYLPILLHILGHEFRHAMHAKKEQSMFDIFIYYMEHVINHYNNKFYVDKHDSFYMEIDADRWSIEELNLFYEGYYIEKYSRFINKILVKRIASYDPSIVFNEFNRIMTTVSKKHVSVWEIIDKTISSYSKVNRDKIVSIIRNLYTYQGDLNMSGIHKLDTNIQGLVIK